MRSEQEIFDMMYLAKYEHIDGFCISIELYHHDILFFISERS